MALLAHQKTPGCRVERGSLAIFQPRGNDDADDYAKAIELFKKFYAQFDGMEETK